MTFFTCDKFIINGIPHQPGLINLIDSLLDQYDVDGNLNVKTKLFAFLNQYKLKDNQILVKNYGTLGEYVQKSISEKFYLTIDNGRKEEFNVTINGILGSEICDTILTIAMNNCMLGYDKQEPFINFLFFWLCVEQVEHGEHIENKIKILIKSGYEYPKNLPHNNIIYKIPKYIIHTAEPEYPSKLDIKYGNDQSAVYNIQAEKYNLVIYKLDNDSSE
jgi:hypothetical protein